MPDLDARTFHIHDAFSILVRRRLLVFLVAVVAALVAGVPAFLAEAEYASTSSVRVRPAGSESSGGNALPDSAANRLIDIATEVEVLKSDAVLDAVLLRLEETDATAASEYLGASIRAVGQTDIIEITARSTTPASAASAANAYANVFVEQRRQQAVEGITTETSELRSRISEQITQLAQIDTQLSEPDLDESGAANLRIQRASLATQIGADTQRADDLDVRASLIAGETQLVSEGRLETEPVAPKPFSNLIVGALLGVFAGAALAFVLDALDDTIETSEELNLAPSIPVLASIPASTRADLKGDDPAIAEAYRYLRTNIQFASTTSLNQSIAISSALEGEGKTTTAIRLALAMTEVTDRVALLDCDFRRPKVHEWFGLDNRIGLSSYLKGNLSLSEVPKQPVPHLLFFPAGPVVKNPSAMLATESFADLLRQVSEAADITIIDTPPILPVADALIIGSLTEGLLLVSRVGEVGRRAVREALKRIEGAHAETIGFVANGVEPGTTYGQYRSSYLRSAEEPSS